MLKGSQNARRMMTYNTARTRDACLNQHCQCMHQEPGNRAAEQERVLIELSRLLRYLGLRSELSSRHMLVTAWPIAVVLSCERQAVTQHLEPCTASRTA